MCLSLVCHRLHGNQVSVGEIKDLKLDYMCEKSSLVDVLIYILEAFQAGTSTPGITKTMTNMMPTIESHVDSFDFIPFT